MILILSIILFFAALLAAFFGLGGGVLYTPFQLWLGIPFQEAAATSLLLILVTSFSATLIFRKSKQVDWILAFLLELPTTIGAFAGGVLSHYVSSVSLTILLTLLLFLAGGLMLFPPQNPANICASLNTKASRWFIIRHYEKQTLSIDLRCVLPIMFVVGALISIVGISGGAIKIPIMVLLFRIPMPLAIGSSAFMVGLTATAGLLGHASVGHVQWQTAAVLIVPVFIGSQLGSRLSVHLKSEKLKRWYGVFLILVAVFTILRVLPDFL
jgi:uncharacterized membrane protein YfcA